MSLLLRAVLASAFLVLAACATPPEPAPKGNIGFSGAPLKLDVASLTIDDRYNPPGKAPNVEHLHDVTPSAVAERWLQSRVVAVGSRGLAVLTIDDARVIEEKQSVKGGLTGFFGDQIDSKIVGTLRGELVVTTESAGGTRATYKAGVNAKSEQTILQSADLNERDRAYFDLMNKLTAEFDRLLTAEVTRTMGSALRP
ncbi:MAG: hypothetical protein Q7S99_01185 [Parvibaculum sp.]|nr:hypothetical protein [Parvibaculum sp.]